MDWLVRAEWDKVFVPTVGLLEIFVRGTLVYLGLFLVLRLVLKRQQGAMGTTDLLVVVLIADAAQNGMADEYHSVPEGLLLVATIVFWNYLLDWLGFRIPRLQRWLKPAPVEVVRDGRMLRKNMANELITEEELWTQLRLAGVEEIESVRRACIESDGRISVLTSDAEDDDSQGADKRTLAG